MTPEVDDDHGDDDQSDRHGQPAAESALAVATAIAPRADRRSDGRRGRLHGHLGIDRPGCRVDALQERVAIEPEQPRIAAREAADEHLPRQRLRVVVLEGTDLPYRQLQVPGHVDEAEALPFTLLAQCGAGRQLRRIDLGLRRRLGGDFFRGDLVGHFAHS